FLAVQQQLPLASGLVVEAIGGAVLGDVGVDQRELAAFDADVRLGDVGAALAQRLHLAAGERQARFERLVEEVVEPGPAVLGDQLRHDAIWDSRPASRIAASTCGRTPSAHGAIGSRVSSEHSPSCASANLVGDGEASRNSALCRRISLSCQARARAASNIAAHACGATLAVTEMQPWPPCAI